MDRTLRLLSLLACLILASYSFAQDYDLEVDGIYYTYDTDKLTATVVAAPYQTPYSGNITIPATFTRGRFTFNVNAIDDNAFNSSEIESVTMLSDGENGVSSINGGAFNYCIYLKKVTFPSTLKTIGKYAFKNCSALPSIDIPSSVINIGNDAFSGCTALTNVKFPDVMSEKSIGDYAFDNCGITTLTLPRGVRQVGKYAFDHCKKLTKVNFPDDFGVISEGMFYGCTSLGEISFPSSLIAINVYAFCNCPLKKIVLSPAIIFISWSAFSGCKQLEEFIIEDGEEPLTCWLTENLPGLKTFYLGRNLDYDGDEERHLNPANLTIGPKVTSLLNIFGDDLKEITCYIKDPTSVPEYFSSKVKANAVLKVPAGSYNLYCNTNGWKDFFFIEKISGGVANNISFADPKVKAICVANWDTDGDGELSKEEAATVTDIEEVFKKNHEITSFDELQFFTVLKSIGDDAFEWCDHLSSITIPNSVTSIGNSAFSNCSGLTSVTIPNNVTSIGEFAFYDCSCLTSVTIPESVTSIGNDAFEYCSSLTSITIPNSMTTAIESTTFAGCTSLTSVTIGNNVTSIEYGAFANCSGLISVTIGNSVTGIGQRAFDGCSSLTSITIPNSVIKIGGDAFANCSGMTSVTIGNSVTLIWCGAFRGCSGLTSVTIPNSVTTIEDYAFRDCSGLTSITIGNSVTTIGINSFGGCINIKDVYCLAEQVPHSYLSPSSFDDTPIEEATLHVPANSVNAYKNKSPWSGFGSIVALKDGEPSGINSVYREASTNDRYYNLNGQRVEKPTKKGVYIVNGKKALYNNQ
jgi:hypothetical protein